MSFWRANCIIVSVFPFFYVLYCFVLVSFVFFFQHIVVEVELGKKTTKRFKSSKAEFTKYAMVNVSLRIYTFL